MVKGGGVSSVTNTKSQKVGSNENPGWVEGSQAMGVYRSGEAAPRDRNKRILHISMATQQGFSCSCYMSGGGQQGAVLTRCTQRPVLSDPSS